MSIQEQLLNIEQEAIGKIAVACTQIELNDLRAFYMGKKSPLGEIMKSMATLSIEDKKIVGKLANEVKGRIEAAVAERRTYLEQEELLNRLFKCDFPYTCPHGRPTIIKYPIYELEKLFKRVNS